MPPTPQGHSTRNEQVGQINVTPDAAKWVAIGLTVLAQAFGLFTYFNNKHNDLKEDIHAIQLELKEREKYIELVDSSKESMNSFRDQLRSIDSTNLENFRDIRSIERRISDLQDRIEELER